MRVGDAVTRVGPLSRLRRQLPRGRGSGILVSARHPDSPPPVPGEVPAQRAEGVLGRLGDRSSPRRSHARPNLRSLPRCADRDHESEVWPEGPFRAIKTQVPPPRRWASAAGARGCGRRCSGQVRENATEAGSRRGSPLRRLRGVGSACPCVADQLRGSVHSSTVSNLNRIPLPSRGPDRTASESHPSGRIRSRGGRLDRFPGIGCRCRGSAAGARHPPPTGSRLSCSPSSCRS